MRKKENPVPVEKTSGTERYADVLYRRSPEQLVQYEYTSSGLLLRSSNGIQLEITVCGVDLLRFRYQVEGQSLSDFSYAVDPSFQPAPPAFTAEDLPETILLRTELLQCFIAKSDLRVRILDQAGQLLREESHPFALEWTILQGTTALCIRQTVQPGETFLGLGDKAGPLRLNGQHLCNWNTDAFAFKPATDPLYKSIPFFYALNQGRAYGIFLDNSYRSEFDFGKTAPTQVQMIARGGEMTYYFLYGPSLDAVAKNYAVLTGRPTLPALWTLGFHQCRWSYYPDSRVREIAREFRERKIPCDAIYLDIDYMDGYRCFTWDHELFPDPPGMIRDLAAAGFKTVAMIDPGIKIDSEYAVYQSGIKGDYFCRRTDGERMQGPVWPQECVFPDFTRPEVRSWWGQLYHDLYLKDGVAGFWNDMNEPAIFKVNHLTFPLQVRHDYEGHPTDHRKAHNIYGSQMARATFNGLQQLQPDRRPFVITRATFSGGQRHAWTWTGDNVASWEHLSIANRQCQRLSISGYSLVGSDIGGFVEVPDGELFVRWLQLGIFHPLFRIHSMGNHEDGSSQVEKSARERAEADNRIDQEPWVFGPAYEALARQAIEWRYRLLPYWYTTIYRHTQSGLPVIRSLIFADPTDAQLAKEENGFLFGEKCLVYPVVEAGKELQPFHLPDGLWYSFWSQSLHHGPKASLERVSLENFPFFVRAGTVLPLFPVQQYTGEREIQEMTLRAYFAEGTHESHWYEDAGEGFAYRTGGYLLRCWNLRGTPTSMEIEQEFEGQYASGLKNYYLEMIGLPFQISGIWVDEQPLPIQLSITLPAGFRRLRVEASK